MKKTAFLFFFLLALSHAFPLACTQTSSRTMAVPALRDDGVGSLVNISVVVLPGSGGIFSSTSPVVGPATQKSQRTAAEYAAGWSGFNASTCDFMFSIESPDVINVDGPSAGAAMALLVSSALQNLSIRGGFTATGTIDENGGIGQVGGLVEKAHAAESAGLSVIALPVLEPSDKIVFHMIQNYSNATFVEVSGFPVLEAIATGEGPIFNSISPPQPNTRSYPLPLGEKKWKYGGDFDAIADGVISGAYEKISRANSSLFSPYLEKELDDAARINSLGYSYTAANIAFLAGMDADLVSTPRAQRGEIIAEARECISRNIGRRPSPSDWEWSAAAQMRLSWAGKKLDEAESRQIEWEGDEVLSLKDAIQARAWCGTAESILMRIPPSATVADQSSARPAADKYIKSAEKLLEITGNTESGLAWHVGTAKQSYERGEYVAAAYDALYGISFSSAPSSVSDYEKVASAMNATEFKSAWGGTYYSQARYTLESGGDLTSVFQLSLYALSLENATTEIGNSLSGNPGDGAVSGRNSGNSDLILLIAAFAMAGVLISVHKLVRDGYGKPTK